MKDAYYFSHDANARNDPKIMALIHTYGMEGYGRWWVLVEMLREQTDYKLKRCEWVTNALAMAMLWQPDSTAEFIDACVDRFELLETDGDHFWSNSLLRRMTKLEDRRKKRSEAGRKGAERRWTDGNAMAMPKQTHDTAIAKDGKVKESTVKQSTTKEKEKSTKTRKLSFGEFVTMTSEEHQKLIGRLGPESTARAIEILDNYKGSKGKKYKSDYRAILSWVVDKLTEQKPRGDPKRYTHQRTDTTELDALIARKTVRVEDEK